MSYNQEYVRSSILYKINNVDQFSVNLTWVLKAFGTNWNDGATVTLGEDNSLESFINHYTGWLAYNFEDETDVSRTKYPITNQFLTTSHVYNPDYSEDDVIVDTFIDIWGPLDTTQTTVVFSDTQKNAVSETGKAIYVGDLTVNFIGRGTDLSSLTDIQKLFEFIWNTPYPSATILPDVKKRLGIALYLIKNAKATVGTFYLDPSYIDANKTTLTGTIESYTNLTYPSTGGTTTKYVDSNGIVYDYPGVDRTSFTYWIPNLLGSKYHHIKLFFYGSSGSKGLNVNFLNEEDTLIKQAFIDSSLVQFSRILTSGFISEDEYKLTQIPNDYYRRGHSFGNVTTGTNRTLNSEGSIFTNEYSLSYPSTPSVVYDSRSPESSNWKYFSLIDDGAVQNVSVNTIIKPSYTDAYSNGTFEVLDGIDDGYLEIVVPGVDIINDVSDGTENLTDALSDNGNYTADDTSIIKEPGSTVEPTTPKEVIDPGTATVSPKVNIAAGFMSTYLCNESNLLAIGQKLYDPTVIDAITKAFTDPIKLIRSLAYIPFKIQVNRDLVPLKVGNYDMGTYAYRVKSMFYDFSYGTLDFTKAWGDTFIQPNSFRSYDEYAKYAIYVPFIGYQQLTANDVMGHKIRLDCQLNIVSGDILVTYWVDQVRRYIWGGNCMFNLPVTDRDFLGGVGAVAGIGASIAAGIATGGSALPVIAAGAAATAGAVGSKTMAPQYTTSGQLGGQLGIMGPAIPFIIQERLITNDTGYKFFGGNVNLSNVPSATYYYAEIISPTLSQITNSTDRMYASELAEIKTLLSEGVWISK